jgi:ankyrin repeat protein
MRYGETNSLILAPQELRAVDNWTLLHYAALVDHFGLAERLIATIEDVRSRTDTGRFTTIFLFVANDSNRTLKLLLDALGRGTIGVQRVLSPLHIGICFISAHTTRVFIDHGAEVNCENQEGVTPFDIAVMNGEAARSIRQMDVPDA